MGEGGGGRGGYMEVNGRAMRMEEEENERVHNVT